MATQETTTLPVSSVLDYMGGARDHAAGLFGPDAVVVDGESGARLTAARVSEFHQRLQALVGEYFAPDAAEWTSPVKYGFRYVLMPIDTAPDDDPRAIRDGR